MKLRAKIIDLLGSNPSFRGPPTGAFAEWLLRGGHTDFPPDGKEEECYQWVKRRRARAIRFYGLKTDAKNVRDDQVGLWEMALWKRYGRMLT